MKNAIRDYLFLICAVIWFLLAAITWKQGSGSCITWFLIGCLYLILHLIKRSKRRAEALKKSIENRE